MSSAAYNVLTAAAVDVNALIVGAGKKASEQMKKQKPVAKHKERGTKRPVERQRFSCYGCQKVASSEFKITIRSIKKPANMLPAGFFFAFLAGLGTLRHCLRAGRDVSGLKPAPIAPALGLLRRG